MSNLLIQTLVAFFSTLIFLRLLSAVAPRVGLVDAPNQRKLHSGQVPLVGGVAIYPSLLLGAMLWGNEGFDSLSAHGKPLWVFLLAGGIIIENVFSLPGIGRLVFQAITQRDLVVVQNVIVVLVFAVVTVTLLIDIAYSIVDPRLRRTSQ